MDSNKYVIDKKLVHDAFSKAANNYEKNAVLQKEVGERIIQRLYGILVDPSIVLDVGAGTGAHALQLAEHYKKSEVIALDIAHAMLMQATKNATLLKCQYLVCGDAEQLPIKDHSVDLIFSNLTLQWCTDLYKTFVEFRRILKEGGLLLFSTFGPDTLKELRTSWQAADQYVHVNGFIDMHDIGDALLSIGFNDPVMDVENFTLTYKTVRSLLLDLKAIGAHNVTAGRPKGLTGKNKLLTMQTSYETFRKDGLLPASYEVIYGHAWSQNLTNVVTTSTSSVTVPSPKTHPK